LISVDRPGFGASNFGVAEPSLAKQSEMLKPILEHNQHNRPVILVGHSLGGPLIARMALDYPELVDGLVMVAPSIDPDLEPNEWFRGPLATPFLKIFLPRSLRASNDEIWKLKPQLQDMVPMWPDLSVKTIVIQGGKDTLVPAGNADFAARMITHTEVEIIRVDDMNHFVPWSHPQLIKEAIMKLLPQRNELIRMTGH
jgi:pimeloyl-ACP methyl ester carboxylesterase